MGEGISISDDGSLSFSFSITVDSDGEVVPSMDCPRCGSEDTEVIESEKDIYKCKDCESEFVPDEFKPLSSAQEYIGRATVMFKQERWKRVIKDCTASIAIDPNQEISYFIRGRAQYEREQYSLAEQDFNESVRLSPNDQLNYRWRGFTRVQLQCFPEAISDFTKSNELKPDPVVIQYRADAYIKSGEYDLALSDYSELIRMNPNQASLYVDRGYTYQLIKDTRKAINDYNIALTLEPDQISALIRRSEAYELQGEYVLAVADLTAGLTLVGSRLENVQEQIDRLNRLRLLLYPQDSVALTIQDFGGSESEEASEPGEEDTEDEIEETAEEEDVKSEWIARGLASLRKKDYPQASEYFEKAIEQTPEILDSYFYRTCSMYLDGRTGPAIAVLEEVDTLEHQDYEDYWLFLSTLCFYWAESVKSPVGQQLLAFLGRNPGPGYHKKAIDYIQSAHLKYLEALVFFCCWHGMSISEHAGLIKSLAEFIDDNIDDRKPLLHGLLLAVAGNSRASSVLVDKAIESSPEEPYLHWMRAFLLSDKDAKAAAINEAIKLSGSTPKSDRILILLDLSNFEVEKASDRFEHLVKTPEDIDLMRFIGVLACGEKRFELAIKYLSPVIEDRPDDSDCLYQRGLAYRGLGDEGAALQDFERALEVVQRDGGEFVDEDQIQTAIRNETQPEEITDVAPEEEPNYTLHAGFMDVPIHVTKDQAQGHAKESAFLLEMGDAEMALERISMAIAGDPTHAEWYAFRAALYRKYGKNDEAIKDFNRAIELDPSNPQFYKGRGILLLDVDSDLGFKDISSAIELDPSDPKMFVLRAVKLMQKGIIGTAIDDLYHALELDSQLVETIQPLMVEIAGHLDEFPEEPDLQNIVKLFTKIISLSNNRGLAYAGRALVFMKIKDGLAALSDTNTSLDLFGKGNENRPITIQYGENEPVLSISDSGIIIEPEKIELAEKHLVEGARLFGEGDKSGALTEFLIARNINPKDARPHEMCWLIYYQQQDWKNALWCVSMLIQLKPDDAVAIGNRGSCYLNLGQKENALKDFQLSIEKDPAYAFGFLSLGTMYLMEGDLQKAIEYLSRAIQLDPTILKAYAYRGNAYENLDMIPQAISDYQHYYDHGGGPEIKDLPGLLEHIKELRNQ